MKYLIHIVTTDLYTSVKNRFMFIRCDQSMRSPEKYIQDIRTDSIKVTAKTVTIFFDKRRRKEQSFCACIGNFVNFRILNNNEQEVAKRRIVSYCRIAEVTKSRSKP